MVPSSAILCPLGGFLGRLGSWVLGRRARTPKSYNNHMKMNERGGGVLTSHCIHVYMCKPNIAVHITYACCMPYSVDFSCMRARPEVQLPVAPDPPQSGGHHYVMYWIPLPRCQRHHHNPVNETFGLAIFVSTALGRLGIGRIGQFLTLRVSPPASVASGSSSARQRADASGGSPAGASPAGGHRRGLCLVPDA